MGLFSFKKSPQEILEDKYLELIDTNGVDELFQNPPWFHYSWKTYYSGVIIWEYPIEIFCHRREDESYSYESYGYQSHSYDITYSFNARVGKIESSSEFARKVWVRMDKLYNKLQEEIKEEQERIEKETEEVEALAKDKVFIEEYNKLCWSTWEFNKHFKLLDDIESLGKEQIKLLEKWEENKNLIYEKREKFYSLTK